MTPWLASRAALADPSAADRAAGIGSVVDRTVVFVVDGDLAGVHGPRLVVDRRNPVRVGPDRSPAGVVVHDDAGVVPVLVQHDVERDGRGDQPAAVQLPTVLVHAGDVAGAELVPGQPPWVHEEGAIGLLVRDVPAQMIVVPFVEEGPGQERDFLLRAEMHLGKSKGDASPPIAQPLAFLASRLDRLRPCAESKRPPYA